MNDKYDIITFNHSFEHIEDPLEILKHANKLLAVNGTCIERIPQPRHLPGNTTT